jgi:non-specific serine/threonine protein kinase
LPPIWPKRWHPPANSTRLVEIEEALRRVEQTEYLWYMPEVLRIKGELLAKHDAADPATVEDHFLQSLDWDRRQQALTSELRTATSLARFGGTGIARQRLTCY